MAGMQKKTINQYLSNRIQYWVWSLNDYTVLKGLLGLSTDQKDDLTTADNTLIADFRNDVHDNTIVTGGAIASMLLGEEVKDIDIYFTNRATACKVAEYYLAKVSQNVGENWRVSDRRVISNDTNGVATFIKSQGIDGDGIDQSNYDYFEALTENEIDKFFAEYRKQLAKEPPKHGVKFVTSNAITLHNGIQIILRFTGTTDQIHENYDFIHATNSWTKAQGVVYRIEAMQALMEKRLIYIGSRFPVSSLFRIRKFLARGFNISAGEITKIAFDVSALDLRDPKVLHDQLIGVDYAYFNQVINLLTDPTKTGPARFDVDIDRTYLFKIINTVYDGSADDAYGVDPDPQVREDNNMIQMETGNVD